MAGLLATACAGPAEAPQKPRAPAEPLPAATIAARQHYFGSENVDPTTGEVRADRVILSWTGVSGFAAALGGHVVLLDAWIPRSRPCAPPPGAEPSEELRLQLSVCEAGWPHSMAYVGTTASELAALAPQAYFFGHGHFDHAGDLPAVLAANPGLAVFGAGEHCDDLAADPQIGPVRCVSVFGAGAAIGSAAELPAPTLPGVRMRAVKQPHAAPDAGGDTFSYPLFLAGESCPAAAAFPPDSEDPVSWLAPTGGSVSLAWQFQLGDFALVWQDTAGPIRSGAQYTTAGLSYAGDQVAETFASLPRSDVRLASVVVSGKSTLIDQLRALHFPQLFVPLHGDPCFEKLHGEIRETLETELPASRRPELLWLRDPDDYLRPLVFDPAAPRWRNLAPEPARALRASSWTR